MIGFVVGLVIAVPSVGLSRRSARVEKATREEGQR
jgi:hypothetical protein